MAQQELRAVLAAFGRDSQVTRVPKGEVLSWMTSVDVEVLGAICHLVVDAPTNAAKVDPPLERSEYDRFIRSYVAQCIRENPQGEWADSRHFAGYFLVGWLLGLWRREELSPQQLGEWKSAAFQAARAWVDQGGESPLSKPPAKRRRRS